MFMSFIVLSLVLIRFLNNFEFFQTFFTLWKLPFSEICVLQSPDEFLSVIWNLIAIVYCVTRRRFFCFYGKRNVFSTSPEQ